MTQNNQTVWCKKLLEKEGFGHLANLLNRKKEIELFREIANYGRKKIKNNRLPQPKLLKKYQIEVSLIPGRLLPVVCAFNGKEVAVTPVGKIIQTLYLVLEKHGLEGYVFLTSGAAKEAIRAKPKSKSKMRELENLKMEEYNPASGPPIIDGDFLLIIDRPKWSIEKIAEYLKREIKNNPLEIKVIESKSRPFKRIDIGKTCKKNFTENFWAENWQSYGHIVPPEFCGEHSFSFSFIQNLMGENDSCSYILIMPVSGGFAGININFFKDSSSYQRIHYLKDNKVCSLKPAVIHWFEIAYPYKNSPEEALAHFLHSLRSATWEDSLPIISNRQIKTVLTKRFQKRNEKIKKYSKETSERLANEIIYSFASHTSAIIHNNDYIRQTTKRLLKTLSPTLNGNPYLGLIYLLAAGENPTDAPVYGTGIIDPKGFFPELYEFLHQKNRLEKLIGLMAETEEGPAMKGWPAFLNFIYSETGFDLKKTAKLLNPHFCPLEIYPTLVEDFISPCLKEFSLPSEQSSAVPVIST